MSKRNENRDGYNYTQAGWIPESWGCIPLETIITGLHAGVSVNSNDEPAQGREIGILKTSAVTNGFFRPEENKRVKKEEVARARVSPQAGSIIISRMNTRDLVGANAYVAEDYPNLRLPDRLWQMRVRDSGACNARWLGYLMTSPRLREALSNRATGTSGSMKNISKPALLSVKIQLPTYSEQEKIAEILSAWDRAIELTRELIAAKKLLKKGLEQQLLTGRMRFPEFGKKAAGEEPPSSWKLMRLHDLFSRVTRPTRKGNNDVLSITAKVGFVDQEIKFSKVIAGRNLERYILLRKGEFAYNKGNSKSYPQGCIYRLDEFEEGLVPNVYYSFKAASHLADAEFYKYYFESGGINQQLRRVINSGVRNDGLLNLSAKDFFQVRVPVPGIDEQRKIAATIDLLTREVDLSKKRQAKYEIQKKGLMQKMLTGEVRVKVSK